MKVSREVWGACVGLGGRMWGEKKKKRWKTPQIQEGWRAWKGFCRWGRTGLSRFSLFHLVRSRVRGALMGFMKWWAEVRQQLLMTSSYILLKACATRREEEIWNKMCKVGNKPVLQVHAPAPAGSPSLGCRSWCVRFALLTMLPWSLAIPLLTLGTLCHTLSFVLIFSNKKTK